MSIHVIAASDQVASKLDLAKVFSGAPMIYTVLLALSVFACVLCLYSLITLREKSVLPDTFAKLIRKQLNEGRYEAALKSCREADHLSAQIIGSGLEVKDQGQQAVTEAMAGEGRRAATGLWQRISLLNDIAVLAPMLGLLGTVLGMFFAFYDTAQTEESLSTIFDGLGIAIGTTVAGLIVAILAMSFYTILKFRVVHLVNTVEDESQSIARMIQQGASS